MKRVSITSTLILFTLLLTAQPARAQEVVSFQGRLTNADGAPVADGSHSVRFQLFEAPTGGSAQWEESHTVTTDDGVFSVLLGTETALDLDAFEAMPYLALTVEGQALAPRTPLTAVPYAMKSYRLDEAALVAGDNVTITRRSDGALRIGAAGGGGGGLTSVATDATMAGNGTSGSPLGLADGSVTGVKLSNNALLAGANVDIVRRGNGSLEISAASSGGGLTQVASDATLAGDGTSGSPLAVAVPLELTGTGGTTVVVQNNTGYKGHLAGATYGVYGEANDGDYGILGGVAGVFGENSNGNFGYLAGNIGAYGKHVASGNSGSIGTSSHAGYFQGNVHVTGNLTKGGGAFKIDHPLDPANKYLAHSFVESPDMMNVYNGNVTTDANGEAVVTLPDYFEALNRDFRYQLTTIGGFAPVYVAEKISGNRFKIAGGTPGMEVSWQVTGIRQDAWAEENRIVVEEDKPAKERGFYLHPTLFGQPPQRSVEWARDPEMMREMQELSAQSVAERRHSEEEDQHLP